MGWSSRSTAYSRIGAALVALALVAAGCAMEQATAEEAAAGDVAVTVQASHKWGNYHWARKTNPFTLTLNAFVTPDWRDELGIASTDWSLSSVLDTTIKDPTATPSATDRKKCGAVSGQIKVCNANYGGQQWLGLAQIKASGSHITQGVAKMNDFWYAPGSSYDTPASRQMVVCQEVAHDFGLGHQDENHYNTNLGSCMDYTKRPEGGIGTDQSGAELNYGPANTAPNAHDYEQLELIYDPNHAGGTGHTDGTTTIKQGGGGGGGAPGAVLDTGNGPENVGEAVGFDADGRPDTFLKRTGPDEVVITHVYWAD